jgi:DNA-binding protein H-NS
MARSLDLDALTEDDMLQLLDEIFSRLSPQRLRDVRDTAEVRRKDKIEAVKNAILTETRAKLEELELTLEEVIQPRPARTRSRRTRRDAGKELPVKYRGPNSETWSGRGRAPQWIRDLEEQGRQRGEFLVSQGEQEGREL